MTKLDTDVDVPIGRRIANARIDRAITASELGRRAGFSYSHITKVEAGHRDASPQLIIAASQALGVSRAELQGQPLQASADQTQRLVEPLRRELAAYATPPTTEAPVADVEVLAGRVAEAGVLRHQVDLAQLGALLPDLLADLRRTVHSTYGTTRETAYELLAESYAAASQLAYKLGWHDLSSIAVDRYEWAAARSADPLAIAVGDYQRAGELANVGEAEAAETVLSTARATIQPTTGADAPTWSILGSLYLKSGLVAARSWRQGRERDVWHYFDAAAEAATQVGSDRDDYRLAFGPSNVAIWRVSLAVEIEDIDSALKYGRDLRLPSGLAAERRSHFKIDHARAQVWAGEYDAAMRSLYAARTVAPQHTRWHPQARETVRALDRGVRKAQRRSLTELKHWFRIR